MKVKVLGKYKSLKLFKLILTLAESMRESRSKSSWNFTRPAHGRAQHPIGKNSVTES